MKLSEAIVLGSTLSKQAFTGGFGRFGIRCALGAAADAAGIPTGDLSLKWPMLALGSFACPICMRQLYRGPLFGIIAHLNDYHKWTREQIAYWVATIEQPEIAPEVKEEREWQFTS